MESALNQEAWIPAVGELYYGLNPISLDESRTIHLERPPVRMTLCFLGSDKWLNSLFFQVVTVRNLTLHDHIIMTLNTLYQTFE